MNDTHLQKLTEHFCQWVWTSFTDVTNRDELKDVTDLLEKANEAADDGNKGFAMGHILSAIDRVFGCNSTEHRQFMHLYFPQTLAWEEHIAETDQRWDATLTQQEATAVMEKVKRRTAELMATSIC
jgi:hypothetical protein